MSDSEPTLRRVAAGTDATDAVLATELRSLKTEVGSLRALMAEVGSLRGDLREYVARQEARDEARREAEREHRERTERRFDGISRKTGALEKRVGELEGFRAKILGAIAVAGAVGGAVGILVQLLMQGAT